MRGRQIEGAWASPNQSPHLLPSTSWGRIGLEGASWGRPSCLRHFPLPSVYRCGSAQGWSRRFRFRALKNGAHWSPRLAVFGDLGADNPKALPRLRRDTQQGMYDAVLHVGEASAGARKDGGQRARGGMVWGARGGMVGEARMGGGARTVEGTGLGPVCL